MLILSFDTATPVASVALVRDREPLGERSTTALAMLAEAHGLLADAGCDADDLDALTVGTGPGSFTGIRIGLAAARGLALARELPMAGVSTLATLAAGAPGAVPVIDARRREVFALLPDGPRVLAPHELEVAPGTRCVGDGAVRYRTILQAAGAEIPPDSSELHRPRARFHAQLVDGFGPAEAVAPQYLRVPDADRARAA
jgi:tRNA threonylcarbamoyladenosine biosynthesis protein TsaB